LGAVYFYRIQGEKGQNIEQAITCYRSALIVLTPTAFPVECLKTSRSLGNTAFTAGLWEIAIEGYEQAMTAVEQSRSWITSDYRRQQIVAESIDVYENAIQACVNSGKLEKAIEYCDRTRSKHLVDLMHSNDLYANGEIPPEVEQYLREFEAKQQEIDAEVQQPGNSSSGNKGLASAGSQSRSRADVDAYTDKIEQLEAEKQQVWENIRRLDPVLAGQIQVDRMKFAAMQQLIDNSNTAIICFYTTRNDTHVFVIYKDKAPQVHTCQGEGLAFQDWIDETWLSPYLADQKNKTNYWEQGMGEFLSQLSQRLKVNDLIGKYLKGIEELIVIPHLYLHQIPLAAFPVGENSFLGDKFLIRYVPSCKILEYCHQRPTIESPQYGIVENATDDLPFTSFECEQVAKLIPVKQRLKGSKEATVAEYRNMVKTINGLHSSHHAKSDLKNPLKSKLLLGDGNISLGELMTPGWRMPELSDVFLSCCETNLGMTEITDNLLSFGTGFLCAGARSVVSTLWEVHQVTGLFSIFYYQYRKKGLSRPEALRDAQVRLRTISGEGLHKLCDLIIKKLNPKLLKVQAEREELKLRQKPYKRGTVEFNELKEKLREIVKQETNIQKEIECYNNLSETFSAMPNPFADLIYWSGFICQGLH
jgi:CHAT domain-containing protein